MFRLFLLICFIIGHSSLSAQQAEPIVMYFAGDFILADSFEQTVGKKMDYPFKKMEWFKDADISMVNLEAPITSRGTPVEKEFNFRMKRRVVSILKNACIDIVCVANNHIYDYGEEGVFDTIELLDSLRIKHVGAGRNRSESRKPVIINVKGFRIGFLAYYGGGRTRNSHPATKDSAGTAPRDPSIIQHFIKKLKPLTDFIVVSFHWGDELSENPRPDQIQMAHQTIDYGADLVIGHHPHVLQGIERYKGKVIAYSLGNFFFGGNDNDTYRTAVLKVNLFPEKKDNPKIEFLPIQIKKWQGYKLEGRDSLEVINNVQNRSKIFEESFFEILGK